VFGLLFIDIAHGRPKGLNIHSELTLLIFMLLDLNNAFFYKTNPNSGG
jgi:hypothetical protein